MTFSYFSKFFFPLDNEMRRREPPYSGLCGFPEVWECLIKTDVVSRDIYTYSFWGDYPLFRTAVMLLLAVSYSCVEQRFLLWRKTINVGCSKTESLTCATTPCCNPRLGAIGSDVRNLMAKVSVLLSPFSPTFLYRILSLWDNGIVHCPR